MRTPTLTLFLFLQSLLIHFHQTTAAAEIGHASITLSAPLAASHRISTAAAADAAGKHNALTKRGSEAQRHPHHQAHPQQQPGVPQPATPRRLPDPLQHLRRFIQQVPKAELHVHVEGTLEPEMMLRFAHRNGLPPPYPSAEAARAAYNFTDLQSFLDLYY
ncbi:hypothetical protein Agub_g5957, partial [Astrephomene gubernaculifera]